jgi:hypothetical protein
LKAENTKILSIKWQTGTVLKSDIMKHEMTYTTDTFPLNSIAAYLAPPQHCINYLSCYIKLNKMYVGSEVLKAVVIKTSVFWDIMPCSMRKVGRLLMEYTLLYPRRQNSSRYEIMNYKMERISGNKSSREKFKKTLG